MAQSAEQIYNEWILPYMKKEMSNAHRTFETGAIRDKEDGKPDMVETTSMYAEWRYTLYMTGKKEKYGEGNFKKGITLESYLKSLKRHVTRLQALYDCEKYGLPIAEWMEPNEDHAAAIRFNADGWMHEEEVAKLRNQAPTNE